MKKIVIISTCPPQKCGLATFTKDLKQGMELDPDVTVDLIAVCKLGKEQFDNSIRFVIDKDGLDSYMQASCIINEEYDYCILQHEFGIFGGADGIFINNLINNLNIPLITVFHTIIQDPTLRKKEIMESLLKKSKQVISLSPKGCSILKEIFPDLDHQKIKMIPHGVPQFDYNQGLAKQKLGLQQHFMMLTFGLIRRSKNLEYAIKSLVGLDLPDFKYFIVGKTHPHVLASEGESYRYELQNLVEQLELQDKVVFVDEFLSDEQLKEYLTACDIYISPYQHKEQSSSGTLSFAVGAGTAVIATPYWHAKDLLIDDRGILTPFDDIEAMRENISLLYHSPRLLAWYRFKAQSFGELSTWRLMANNYIELLSNRTTPIRSLEYFENYISFDMRREA
ncbi:MULTISPECIES: glycosyltransferase [unclassified Sphingobacterium]|uniref:glycosyltransferase n=1 Tax=unclassified Sphingobacterium TaxID=2609468 RepID=UPI00104625DA|nr:MULTISPECIES: glycosyltransferase [unclassified Sphingobacterium]MCS3556863.1 glycosyltransferase involved in cell wall biosynthesis [Sphingobacterium sp. JUb21]TCQ99212.1 glycosyltransferase involved in cell wall biosynthesis [Sphingobacterium sp. JUb20]